MSSKSRAPAQWQRWTLMLRFPAQISNEPTINTLPADNVLSKTLIKPMLTGEQRKN